MADSTGSTKKTIVLGDFIDDVWYRLESNRNSQDTGEPIIASTNDAYLQISFGGAGNVDKHLTILGIDTRTCRNYRSTPVKERLVVNNKVLVRVDKNDVCYPPDLSTFLWDNVQSVVIADYAKGAITADIRRWLWLHRDKYQYLFVDTKQDPVLWTDLRDKAIFFPNEREYEAHRSVYDCMRWTVVKLGGRGARLQRYGQAVATCLIQRVNTLNTCGAGDAFMGAFAASCGRRSPTCEGETEMYHTALVDACEYVRGRLLINTDTPRTI